MSNRKKLFLSSNNSNILLAFTHKYHGLYLIGLGVISNIKTSILTMHINDFDLDCVFFCVTKPHKIERSLHEGRYNVRRSTWWVK